MRRALPAALFIRIACAEVGPPARLPPYSVACNSKIWRQACVSAGPLDISCLRVVEPCLRRLLPIGRYPRLLAFSRSFLFDAFPTRFYPVIRRHIFREIAILHAHFIDVCRGCRVALDIVYAAF